MDDNTSVAEAFSRHEFERALPRMAQNVTWTAIGGATLHTRDEVEAACRKTAEYLDSVDTEFSYFRTVSTESTVVTESRATYRDPDGVSSSVASCDLYDFENGQLVAITSYTVELPNES